MINKFKTHIYTNPLEYISNTIEKNRKIEIRLFFLYALFNIISILGAFIIVVITTIFASGLVWKNFSDWYYFFTISFSAGTSLITSLLSFFVVKDRLQTIRIQRNEITAEMAFYVNYQGLYTGSEKERNYKLFVRISAIMGSVIAKKEANFE